MHPNPKLIACIFCACLFLTWIRPPQAPAQERIFGTVVGLSTGRKMVTVILENHERSIRIELPPRYPAIRVGDRITAFGRFADDERTIFTARQISAKKSASSGFKYDDPTGVRRRLFQGIRP